MGGLFGFVGLGRVNGSQKTTPLEALLLRAGSTSGFSLVDKMELCETPVEWDLEIRLAAVGVAVCKTGRLMTGLEGTKGNVEDLGKFGFLSGSEGEVEPPHGKVLVLDSNGIVTEVVGLVAVITSEVVVLGSSFLIRRRAAGLGGGGGAAFLAFVGDVVLMSTVAAADSLLDFSDLFEETTAFSSTSADEAALRLLALWLVLAVRG